MPVSIFLDVKRPHFTNLDLITGKVIVHLRSETDIAGIQVKLEGESRTRLQEDTDKRRTTEVELHKVRYLEGGKGPKDGGSPVQLLYKVEDVFPTPGVFQRSAGPSSYTFAPGDYEFPFQFKVRISFVSYSVYCPSR